VQLSGSGALGDRLSAFLKQRLGAKLRVRADTFGYAQRSFGGLASETDAAEAREVGRVAVKVATQGHAPRAPVDSCPRAKVRGASIDIIEHVRARHDATQSWARRVGRAQANRISVDTARSGLAVHGP
jgi:6-phosphofructokinase